MTQLIQWYGPETGTSYDTTRIYRSDTGETGTYTLVASVTPITTTIYWDKSGDSASWYKIAFYDVASVLEGPTSTAFYASATSTLYVTPTEVRRFMGFATTDFPIDEDATLLIEQAHVQISQDIGTKNAITVPARLKLLGFLLSASFICRSLATRALSKGYVSVSLEGVNIMKAHDGLLRLADYYFQLYQEQLAKDTIDYTATSYLAGILPVDTVNDIRDTMNGVTNGKSFDSMYMPGIRRRQ